VLSLSLGTGSAVCARWVSLALDAYRQDFWPPLHPWYMTAFFAVLRPSTMAARLSSAVAFVGAGLAIYAGGRQFADGTSILAAAVGYTPMPADASASNPSLVEFRHQ
jgi:hypothetical protein